MKKTTWLLVALAASVVAGAWRIWDQGRDLDPAQLLAEAEALVGAEDPDLDLALGKLDRALLLAEDPELRRSLLDERSKARAQRGAITLAMEDLQQLVAEGGLNPVALEIRRAGLMEREGEHAAAREVYEDLLGENPKHGWVKSLYGDVLRKQADARTLALREELSVYIDSLTLKEVMEDVKRLSCLPAGDPLRIGLEAGLWSRLPKDARLPAALGISELAKIQEQARRSYATSFSTSLNEKNLFGLIDLLHSAGRLEETIDLGLAIADLDDAVGHSGTLQRLALALEAQGRPMGAAAVVNDAIAKDPTWHVDFLPDWCAILYRAGTWQRLELAATQLGRSVGTKAAFRELRNAAHFYQGMASYHLGRHSAARPNLSTYLQANPSEPVEDAICVAWQAMADMDEQDGKDQKALGAWAACTRANPLFSSVPWLRLMEDRGSSPGQGLQEADATLWAIAAEPALAYELGERLVAATERGMSETGRDLGVIRQQLTGSGRWYPDGSPTPVLLAALARTHLENNDPAGAAITARRLLQNLPELVPALETLGLAYLVQGRDLERFEVLLRIVEATDAHPDAIDALEEARADLGEERVPTDLLIRWMVADPEFTGAMELAMGLAQSGRKDAALAALLDIDRERFDERDRIVYGELLLEVGQYEAALNAIQPVEAEGALGLQVALLRLAAGAASGRAGALEKGLTGLEELLPSAATRPDERLVDAAFDHLLAGRIGPAVLRMTTLLAETPLTRDGTAMGRAALAELLFGDLAAAEDWLDRSEAFLVDGSPMVGRMVLAFTRGDEQTVVELARELRHFEPGWLAPHHIALLSGLEGRLGEAGAQVSAALAEPTPAHEAQLVAAALASVSGLRQAAPDELGGALGPEAGPALSTLSGLPELAGRQVLLILLALDSPQWNAWGFDRLGERTNRLVLGPFASMLAVDQHLALGELDEAEEVLLQGRKRWPSFLPFWDQLEDLALLRHGRLDHPQLVGLRQLRRAAGVAPRDGIEPTEAELQMDASIQAAARGDGEVALAQARAARDAAPSDPTTLHHLATTAQRFDPPSAPAAWRDLLLTDEPLSPDLAAEARTSLAVALDVVGAEALSAEDLLALQGRYPDSPGLALAVARRMAADLVEASTGLGTVLELLDRFRETHRDLAFDRLEPGASRRWFGFLAAYDPARALALAEEQLGLAPDLLESWSLVARGLEVTGQRSAARSAWRDLARMTSAPDVLIEAATWLAELGGSHEEVVQLLQTAAKSPGGKGLGPAIEYVRGRSLANVGRAQLAAAAEVFEGLMSAPEAPGLDRNELVGRLGITYLQRGRPGDGALAKPLLEQAAAATADPLRRDLLESLASMSVHVDRKRKEEAEAAAEEAEPETTAAE